MVMASGFFPAFSAGELSPLLFRRIDLTKFGIGCQKLVNFLPLPEGPIVRRPGTQYLGDPRATNDRVFLRPFIFGPLDAWVLEFSTSQLRFWWQGAKVGAPYTLATPWLGVDLLSDDGTFALSLAQARDRVFIAGGDRSPRVLSRQASTSWTLDVFDPDDGPFRALNTDEANTVYVSAGSNVVGGLVDITLSSAFSMRPDNMAAGDRWRVRIFAAPDDQTRPWASGTGFTAGDQVYYGKNFYKALNTATSGSSPPTHTVGSKWDKANTGVEWQYLHSGYGVLKWWANLTSTTIRFTIETLLPDSLFSSSYPSSLWQSSEFSTTTTGYGDYEPQVVAFAFDRLVLARNTSIWFSRLDDYFSFADRTAGEILADDAISIELKGRGVTRVLWMEETAAGLLVGTDGGEFVVRPANSSEVFGSVLDGTRNVEARRQTTYGSKDLPPVLAHGRLLQIDATGRKLRELDQSIEKQRITGFEMTALASHVLAPGVRWMAWQGSPDNILWLGLTDGRFVSCTYLPEQDITAFATHEIGALDGEVAIVEDGCVIPSDDGTRDELWLCVRRDSGTPPKRWIERLSPRWDFDAGYTAADSRHLDGHLYAERTATTGVSGAGHLANETVPVVADGLQGTVALNGSGAGTLATAAAKVCLGVAYTSRVEFLVPDQGGTDGPGVSKLRRVRHLILGLLQACEPFRAGVIGSERTFDALDLSQELNQPVRLQSDDVRVPSDLGWKRRPLHAVDTSSALPFCLASAMMRGDTSE